METTGDSLRAIADRKAEAAAELARLASVEARAETLLTALRALDSATTELGRLSRAAVRNVAHVVRTYRVDEVGYDVELPPARAGELHATMAELASVRDELVKVASLAVLTTDPYLRLALKVPDDEATEVYLELPPTPETLLEEPF